MTHENNSNITSITTHQKVDIAPSDVSDTSIAQAAECALDTLNHKLQVIRELAVQATNATISDIERQALQSEVNKLVAEIKQTTDVANSNANTD